MPKIAVPGAGITGVTSAYALREAGHDVVVIDRHRYPAMETSYVNGGQLSACNAEVWNNIATLSKGLRWMLRPDAPLSINLTPTWHKASWIAEFIWAIRKHRENTLATVQLAIEARAELQRLIEKEGISFDLERRGILHVCHNNLSFEAGPETSRLLRAGGLERRPLTSEEVAAVEPALRGRYYGGFLSESDASGDIHKFTRALTEAGLRSGIQFFRDAVADSIDPTPHGVKITVSRVQVDECAEAKREEFMIDVDAAVVCLGVESRRIARSLGDRINVYPVKGYSITVMLVDIVNSSLSDG